MGLDKLKRKYTECRNLNRDRLYILGAPINHQFGLRQCSKFCKMFKGDCKYHPLRSTDRQSVGLVTVRFGKTSRCFFSCTGDAKFAVPGFPQISENGGKYKYRSNYFFLQPTPGWYYSALRVQHQYDPPLKGGNTYLVPGDAGEYPRFPFFCFI